MALKMIFYRNNIGGSSLYNHLWSIQAVPIRTGINLSRVGDAHRTGTRDKLSITSSFGVAESGYE